jgi:RNA polymerase sigma factor (sigma-70 family)
VTDLPPRAGDDTADALLLERARAGDSEAFGELYRQEVDAATRLARILVGEGGADELVAESFARVLTQLQAGRGPTEDFRAYLQVTIRNGFRDGLRAAKESPSSDQPWLLDDVLPPVEELVEDLDRAVAVSALATLPKSWQQVLWHLEVEGRKPAEVATILDMDAGAVSSLAYRAREGLKRAYLDQHLQPASGGACGWTQTRMSQYVRGDLSVRAEQKVAAHLDDCSACGAAYLAVDRVNQKLAAWLFPVVLWGIAGASKGGLIWFAGAAGAGGVGATGTPINGPSGTAPNPLVLGAAATAVACGIAGGIAFAVTSSNDDKSRDDSSSVAAPDGGDQRQQRPPAGPTDRPPSATNSPATNSPAPVVAPPPSSAPTTEIPTPTQTPTEAPPQTEPTDTPPSAEPTDSPTTTDPTPTELPPTSPPAPEPVEGGLANVDVVVAPDGSPARGPFEVTVDSDAAGDPDAEIRVTIAFDDVWLVSDLTPADGWTCGVLTELLVGLTNSVTCTFDYTGTAPGPLGLRTEAPPLTQRAVKPHGDVTLTVDGEPGDPGSLSF